MSAVPAFKPSTEIKRAKVIDLSSIIKGGEQEREIKLNKDGSVDKRHCNKVAGISSEVYPFTSEQEIKAMIDLLA